MSLDQDCVAWGQAILRDIDRSDWEINFSPGESNEGIALQESKVIYIHWPEGEPHYPLMLHEITHAQIGNGHDSHFAHAYMYLVEKYFKPEGIE